MAKIPLLQEEFNKLSESIQNVEPKTTTKILEGEDFKRYVSELRGKSTNFKLKKAQLSAILSEFGILQRTEQVNTINIRFWKRKSKF
jgi:intraflagellar transport protein 81